MTRKLIAITRSKRRISTYNNKRQVVHTNVNVESAAKLIALTSTLAAAVAVCYDIGYFNELDGHLFTLFSISDHILFALEILPLWLVLGLLAVTVLIAVIAVGSAVIAPHLSTNDVRHRIISNIGALMGLPLFIYMVYPTISNKFTRVIFADVHNHQMIMVDLAFLWVMGIVLWHFGSSYVSNNDGGFIARYFKQFCGAIAVGMLLSTSGALGALISEDATSPEAEASHNIETKASGSFDVRIIMSDDKGVLLFDTRNKQILFVRWDDIKIIRSRIEAHSK